MAFPDFAFLGVIRQLGLTLAERDLSRGVAPAEVTADLAERVADRMELASNIDTEKAKSEFVVAPILQGLRAATGASSRSSPASRSTRTRAAD